MNVFIFGSLNVKKIVKSFYSYAFICYAGEKKNKKPVAGLKCFNPNDIQ